MTHTVLLVEDDPRTRERLAQAIAAHPDLKLLAAVGSCAEARAALASQAPDALLLDLGLPDGDGMQLLPEARRTGAQVLVLSVFKGARERAAVAAGARDCLLKDSSDRSIGRAVTGLFAAGA